MTAKTTKERSAALRERMKAAGFTHCAVYVLPKDHAAIRELAKKLQRDAIATKQAWGVM
jgi:hypothetical protein